MTDRPCWAHDGCHGPVRLYQNGPACQAHSPAALNDRTAPVPDPDLTIAGLIRAAGGTYDRPLTPAGTTYIDQKAIASGKRRAPSNAQRLARAELDSTRRKT